MLKPRFRKKLNIVTQNDTHANPSGTMHMDNYLKKEYEKAWDVGQSRTTSQKRDVGCWTSLYLRFDKYFRTVNTSDASIGGMSALGQKQKAIDKVRSASL